MLKPEMFSDRWYREDFVVPIDKSERAALRLKLEEKSRMGEMFMPDTDGQNHAERRAILMDRLKMIGIADTLRVTSDVG